MGWNIKCVKNSVKINSQIATALYNCGAPVCFSWQEECAVDWPLLPAIIYDGELVFNPDHQEHMDYVWQKEVMQVLKDFKIKGDICFSSDEGDNKGQRWGYRFDGEGGMVELIGKKTTWVEKGETQGQTREGLGEAQEGKENKGTALRVDGRLRPRHRGQRRIRLRFS